MDLWEANNAATAFTPHSCNETGVYACSGTACGGGTNKYKGVCDADGCDYNAYRMGATDFYGPGLTVDTTKPFTVVTQFLTHDNTSAGTLSEIRRIYVQGGKVIQNAVLKTQGIDKTNTISEDFCAAQKSVFGGENAFAEKGGMAGMGGALGRGMVLALSIWDDAGSNMLWLDGTFPTTATNSTPGAARGPCSSTSGKPADNMKNYPDAAVVFSKIKSGDLGSTFKAA
jgi:cellulose 1,4-beta-cellobiosidase